MLDNSIHLPGWFTEPGAYVLVDGQFGSTGKGLMAGVLAEYAYHSGDVPNKITTNAGPNSGHTAYFGHQSEKPEKIVTQQLPIASVFLNKLGHKPYTILNAGAVISPAILEREVAEYYDYRQVLIHPAAALITPADIEADHTTTAKISGTGKGIGPAMARKLMRHGGSYARDLYMPMLPRELPSWDQMFDWSRDVVFVETAQGYSLGINSARFFPYTTSRECTVMQAISDARIPARKVKKVVACFRTYPIRVGSVPDSSSGDWYSDQRELTWEEVGQPPELTTVTKRIRRVASWSRTQFVECVAANEPEVIFLNFANYLRPLELGVLIDTIEEDYGRVMGCKPVLLLGHGPHSHEVERVL